MSTTSGLTSSLGAPSAGIPNRSDFLSSSHQILSIFSTKSLSSQTRAYRPTINSYMYGDAVAIAHIAEMGGQPEVAKEYEAKAEHLRQLRVIPWIDEDLDADSGEWLARDILISRKQPPPNRGRFYNHSGYADLVITGLIGIRPSPVNNYLVIHPLIPAEKWDYFALDGVPYHGHLLTVFYDRTGQRYHHGAGLTVLCDGRTVDHEDSLNAISVLLPEGGE